MSLKVQRLNCVFPQNQHFVLKSIKVTKKCSYVLQVTAWQTQNTQSVNKTLTQYMPKWTYSVSNVQQGLIALSPLMPSFFWLVALHIPSPFPQPRSPTHAWSTSCLWLYVFLWSSWCWQPFCSCAAKRRHKGRLMVSILQMFIISLLWIQIKTVVCLRFTGVTLDHRNTEVLFIFIYCFYCHCWPCAQFFFPEPNHCLNPPGKSALEKSEKQKGSVQ